jgi:hypothetical protein
VELVRLVKLVREGEQVKFSKRAGNVVSFDELLDEVGEDVARYFYVRSSHKTEMNFDLDLAIKHSDENPVFYVQYAHARISSIFERAGTSHETWGEVRAGISRQKSASSYSNSSISPASYRTQPTSARCTPSQPTSRRSLRASTSSIPSTASWSKTLTYAPGVSPFARPQSPCSAAASTWSE